MTENNKQIEQLTEACLAGSIDREGMRTLNEWIEADPANERRFLARQQEWFDAISQRKKAGFDKNRAFQRFKERTDPELHSGMSGQAVLLAPAETSPATDSTPSATIRRFPLHRLWQYAAAIVVLFVVSFFAYRQGEHKADSRYTDIEVQVPLGSRTQLQLPDGSTVWLNGGSHISYSQAFGIKERRVKMKGEGYFEVRKDLELPFQVNSPSLSVRVTGTKFNFRDYTDDEEAIVSLAEGKVCLYNLLREEQPLALAPNERAVLNKQSGRLKWERASANNAIEWTNGYLFFDEELLPDIVKELERSYNVRIEIANEQLNSFKFYGNFTRREQSITEVLSVLSATGKMQFRQEGDRFVLY